MNINEPEFENELRALRPLAPSHALEEAIAREMAVSRAVVRAEPRAGMVRRSEPSPEGRGIFAVLFPRVCWAFAGAAAAVAAGLVVMQFQKPAAMPSVASAVASAPDFQAVEVTRDLVAAEDGGVVYEDEEEPARLVRYATLERHVWLDPATGARLEIEVPREDLVLVPIAMQ